MDLTVPDRRLRRNGICTLPSLELLSSAEKVEQSKCKGEIKDREQFRKLEEALTVYNTNAKVIGMAHGNVVNRYILHTSGESASALEQLDNEIADYLSVSNIRKDFSLSDKNFVSYEVPNKNSPDVKLSEVLTNQEVSSGPSALCVGFGKDIGYHVITLDISELSQILIAGNAGSGKNTFLNMLLAGFLYKVKPDEMKLILIDTTKKTLKRYDGIPHLLTPVVSDKEEGLSALHWLLDEMERRNKIFADAGVKDLVAYNAQTDNKIPVIVTVVAEMQSLMAYNKAGMEAVVYCLSMKARECGIHLILATNHPSVDVVTRKIRKCIPSRIAFAVNTERVSQTILETIGADKLLGFGDMLYLAEGKNYPLRVQGAFVSKQELERIIEHIKKQKFPAEYDNKITITEIPDYKRVRDGEKDDWSIHKLLLDNVILLTMELGEISVSTLVRKVGIDEKRAERLITIMEKMGIIILEDNDSVNAKPRFKLCMAKEAIEREYLKKN